MTTEKVYSPIFDRNIKKDISNSPIWKDCYHEDDELPISKTLWCYTIKFDGLVPVQVTNVEKL